jgi:hypothetical protein
MLAAPASMQFIFMKAVPNAAIPVNTPSPQASSPKVMT